MRSLPTYVFDTAAEQRPWADILPGHQKCTLGEIAPRQFMHNSRIIEDGVIVIHRSQLIAELRGDTGYEAWLGQQSLRDNGPVLIIVSGGPQKDAGKRGANVYVRHTKVISSPETADHFFAACFKRWHSQASEGHSNFSLLEPRAIGDELIAAFVLMVMSRRDGVELPAASFWDQAKVQFELFFHRADHSNYGKSFDDLLFEPWPGVFEDEGACDAFLASMERATAEADLR